MALTKEIIYLMRQTLKIFILDPYSSTKKILRMDYITINAAVAFKDL